MQFRRQHLMYIMCRYTNIMILICSFSKLYQSNYPEIYTA